MAKQEGSRGGRRRSLHGVSPPAGTTPHLALPCCYKNVDAICVRRFHTDLTDFLGIDTGDWEQASTVAAAADAGMLTTWAGGSFMTVKSG